MHIGNHSYVVDTDIPQIQVPSDSSSKVPIENNGGVFTYPCPMCREAFMFSLKNGVINVVARGNSQLLLPGESPTTVSNFYPQAFPDNWIISVGASTYDGTTVREGINQTFLEQNSNFYSLYGGNMDLIAPGSDSIAFTGTATTPTYPNGNYEYYSGTSLAAPHVSGVVALLLSHFNQECDAPSNLSIEDVEYILENSAVDVLNPGPDQVSGAGRLDAGAAMQMLDFPTKQIVHPDSIISTSEIARDTIAIKYNQAFVADGWGPISQPFPLEQQQIYRAERVLMENRYSISEYVQPTTNLLGVWPRPSGSNATIFYNDSMQAQLPQQLIDTGYYFDIFDMLPFDTVFNVDLLNNEVKVRGYYYHFIGVFNIVEITPGPDVLVLDPGQIIDAWLPADPTNDGVKLGFSLYIEDDSLTTIYDQPCSADNLLFDENWEWPTDTSGLDEFNESGILVYPNPFDDIVRIEFDGKEGRKEIDLVDLNGRVISHASTVANSYILSTQNLSHGVYFLTCIIDETRYTSKILKK